MIEITGDGSIEAVTDRLAELWPTCRLVTSCLPGMSAFSTVFTRRGLLFCPVGGHDERLIGIGVYVLDDGFPHHWGLFSRFLGDRWQKILGLPTCLYQQAAGERGELLPGLGRLATVARSDVAAVVDARSPDVLRANAADLARLSGMLGVSGSVLGVYGSTLYKRPEHRSDFDFVVYGEAHARRAHAKVADYLACGEPYVRNGIRYHLRFRVPGSDTWYDPRYWRPEPYTAALAAGRFSDAGAEDIGRLEVTDDLCGIFTPSVYGLADGTRLLSYRFGHAGYLKAGDRISGSQIPVYEMRGVTYRVVLGYEDLRKEESL